MTVTRGSPLRFMSASDLIARLDWMRRYGTRSPRWWQEVDHLLDALHLALIRDGE
jgi:hypothetical protein